MLPQLSRVEVLILSVTSLKDLATLEVGYERWSRQGLLLTLHAPSMGWVQGLESAIPAISDAMESDVWRKFMATMRKKWRCKRVAVCFKSRDSTGIQRRWSGNYILCRVSVNNLSG